MSAAAAGDSAPELSVVVPALDDAGALGLLLGDLARQRDVRLEVVVADGGSRDGTAEAALRFAAGAPFPVRAIRGPAGRGRQMNEGARLAGAPDLLFLHADTRLDDEGLLSRAREHLGGARGGAGSDRVAGHFPLRFGRDGGRRRLAYHFYEAKTRLDRADCVRGDQGFWLSRRWFEELGRFDESLPFLEDVRLSERVARTGRWALLPGHLTASPRRFEAEGLLRRQTLNALLLALEAVGETSFAAAAPGLYRAQGGARRLDLRPFFREAHRAMARGAAAEILRRWYRAGSFARGQAWQLALWLDCLGERRAGLGPGESDATRARAFGRWFDAATDNAAGRLAAAALTAAWFYATWAALDASGFGRPRRYTRRKRR